MMSHNEEQKIAKHYFSDEIVGDVMKPFTTKTINFSDKNSVLSASHGRISWQPLLLS